jgi:lipopolysaccharide/colanic/teichoic acid biosynthesis glycosyltransferase
MGQQCDGQRWLVLSPAVQDSGHWTERFVRWRDVLLGALAIVILSPLLLFVAALIKFGSPGPVFYATVVVGKNKRLFTWRKFRSMIVMPEAEDAQQRRDGFKAYVEGDSKSSSEDAPTKLIDARRVTPVGRFIRKYSIDELPQLWNVLRGEMSLVGPRPCLPYEEEFFAGWRGRRFDVKPGLSGVWQVYGRGRAGFDESSAMDVYYVYRRSFGFDLRLILQTFGVVLTGKGAL